MCPQWLSKTSHLIQGCYADNECKQAKCSLLVASIHVYGHQNNACRTSTRLKKRQCAIPITNFVVRSTNATLSRKTEVIVASWQATLLQTSTHRTIWNWAYCKDPHFLTNGPWYGFTVLQGWKHSMSVFFDVSHGRELWTNLGPCNSVWPSVTHWFHIRITVNRFRPMRLVIPLNPHSRQAIILSLEFQHLLAYISSYYSSHNTILRKNWNYKALF